LASAIQREKDIESEGKVLNLRWLQNRKIFVTSERSSGIVGIYQHSKWAKLGHDVRLLNCEAWQTHGKYHCATTLQINAGFGDKLALKIVTKPVTIVK